MVKRHPLLYYSRYILLSKNYTGNDAENAGCYNDINDINDIPQLYFDVNAKIPLTPEMDEFDKALAIATYLRTSIKGGPGLSLSSEKTLQSMIDGKGGVCNDFTQVFNNFCVINHIKVKEWNCVDRFYATLFGHNFNEIYSSRLQKWIAIDVHQSFYFLPEEGDIPLSTIETFSRLRDGKRNRFHFFVPGFEPKSMERLQNIYAKTAIPFLTVNYKNRIIDQYLDQFTGKFPMFIITSMMILMRKNFYFLFVLDNYKVKLLPKYFQNLAAK